VWFRRDLRLTDNPAWSAASRSADRLSALYVIDPVLMATAGPFRRAQLLAHLHALDEALHQRGGRLLVHGGDPAEVVPRVSKGLGAAVFANADVTPYARRRDLRVGQRVEVPFHTWWGGLVQAPGTVVTAQGQTSRVFTPFFRQWEQAAVPPWPDAVPVALDDDPGQGLPALEGQPWQAGGEAAARDRLRDFAQRADRYDDVRDQPALDGTSGLSADLRFGTLSPREVLHAVGTFSAGRAAFGRQLAWRDWYAHLLWEVPTLVETPLRPELATIAWENDSDDLVAWQQGRTGYPIVDAGMRQLATTGFMHNRVRMITASFLIKDLLIDWRRGERWFRRLLVDADVPQNAGNWQWVAGTGPDAAPYFRIFNPVRQSETFDPTGGYIRRYVPELDQVPDKWIHAPWTAPPFDLALAGVTLGDTYPYPMVDHAAARQQALAAYGAAKAAAS
jgi:deoxyribodipyrimidine photo-lyase